MFQLHMQLHVGQIMKATTGAHFRELVNKRRGLLSLRDFSIQEEVGLTLIPHLAFILSCPTFFQASLSV